MGKGKLYLIGGSYGLSLSVILSVISSFAIGRVIGGWDPSLIIRMILTCCMPFTVIYSILAVKLNTFDRKKRWLVAALSAFLILLFSGSIGAVIVESYTIGFENVNIKGFFMYAPIYAISFLPLTWPIVYFTCILLESIIEWRTHQEQ